MALENMWPSRMRSDAPSRTTRRSSNCLPVIRARATVVHAGATAETTLSLGAAILAQIIGMRCSVCPLAASGQQLVANLRCRATGPSQAATDLLRHLAIRQLVGSPMTHPRCPGWQVCRASRSPKTRARTRGPRNGSRRRPMIRSLPPPLAQEQRQRWQDS